jgi:O-antigen/teichoic acid export membrane protein
MDTGKDMDQMMENNPTAVNASLTHRTLHALKWRYIGIAFQVVLQFIVGIVLARPLSPEAFGTVGLALIVIGF